MTHRIAIQDEPRFLHVVVTGQNSGHAVRAYLIDIIALCTARGASHLLIEENLAGPSLDSVEVFAALHAALEHGPTATRYVAVVDTNPGHDPALMRFAETIGVNRGVNVRTFPGVSAAAQWLAAQLPA